MTRRISLLLINLYLVANIIINSVALCRFFKLQVDFGAMKAEIVWPVHFIIWILFGLLICITIIAFIYFLISIMRSNVLSAKQLIFGAILLVLTSNLGWVMAVVFYLGVWRIQSISART